MRMILAIDNKNIEEKLQSIYEDKYDIVIVNTKEMIIESLTENSIVILREDINGNMEFIELIKKIKTSSEKIIVITKKLTQKMKEDLFSKEVFNIIEGNEFLLEDLVDMINSPKMIVYKNSNLSYIKSKVICITGSRGVGKTVSSIILGKLIAKNTNKKVIVVDLDFIYPTLETYLNISKNYSLGDYINDVINNKLKPMHNYESSDLKYSNLKYLLNSNSLGIPKNDVICKIITSLEENYDYIIIDTSSLMINKIYNISKEKRYNIILVIAPGKKALKDFKIDFLFIDKLLLLNSIIICNKCRNIKQYRDCCNQYKYSFSGRIYFMKNFTCNDKIIKFHFRTFLSQVLKEVGIIKYENFKLKIIEKILNIGVGKK